MINNANSIHDKSGQIMCFITGQIYLLTTHFEPAMSKANKMSGVVANELSGFNLTLGGEDETDRIATGDIEDEI